MNLFHSLQYFLGCHLLFLHPVVFDTLVFFKLLLQEGKAPEFHDVVLINLFQEGRKKREIFILRSEEGILLVPV